MGKIHEECGVFGRAPELFFFFLNRAHSKVVCKSEEYILIDEAFKLREHVFSFMHMPFYVSLAKTNFQYFQIIFMIFFTGH